MRRGRAFTQARAVEVRSERCWQCRTASSTSSDKKGFVQGSRIDCYDVLWQHELDVDVITKLDTVQQYNNIQCPIDNGLDHQSIQSPRRFYALLCVCFKNSVVFGL